MTKEALTAYVQEFVKRAQEYGLSEGQAIDLCKQHTSAFEEAQKMTETPAAQAGEAKTEAAK